MTATRSEIDTARLEKVKRYGHKITARCPACSADGGDKSGTHFFLNTENGKFGCARFQEDKEHRREIFRLVGIKGDRDPAEERRWKLERAREAELNRTRRGVSAALRAKRDFIVANYPWTAAEALSESPTQDDGAMNDPRGFLAALFPQDAIVWTGEVHHSGDRHADHWQTVADWQNFIPGSIGPMTSPAIWKPGTVSRSGQNVAAAPFTVLDFDGFDGKKPQTSTEIRDHLTSSMAIIRWIREKLEWQLAAILHTGNVSLHAWFHRPSPEALNSVFHAADALGIDGGLIEHPEHPCRLPGWRHHKTGKLSRVIYLTKP